MEAIKKKLASLKEEKEIALERAEEAEREKKEAEAKVDAVSLLFASIPFKLSAGISQNAFIATAYSARSTLYCPLGDLHCWR